MKKEIGFIGLGRMGMNMATHLHEAGFRVIGMDSSDTAKEEARGIGLEVVGSYGELAEILSPERLVWVMVPSQVTGEVISRLAESLSPGDTVIDGGNSFYKDSLRRHKELAEQEIQFLDCGTSGGTSGAREGASLMIGGDLKLFEKYEGVFETLGAENGYARVGEKGAGHFVKMIHNGIEYGMMGAIAEGVAVLHEHEEEFGIDVREVMKPYEHESIITSKLVSWLARAYEEGQIEQVAGEVPHGETEEEMEHITTIGEVKVLEAALAQRKATRNDPSYLGKLVASMRNQFGGHKTIEKK